MEYPGAVYPVTSRGIAVVLFDMDAELATFEAPREKTGDLKQGIIQELLTRRIRLV
jgi:hypothetical protein